MAGEQSRTVGVFSKIRTQGALIVNVQVGKTQSITVKGDDRFLAKVVTEVIGEELLISYKEKHSMRMSDDLMVTVTVPELVKFKMEGAGKTTISNINTRRFELNYEGVGALEVSGKVESFKLRAQGIGLVDAKDLHAEYVDASVEGIGSVKVYATDRLKASVQGIGSLNYYGNPRSMSKSVEGLGSVTAGD
jgi:hypothetical protein